MVRLKIVFFVLIVILAAVIFVSPMFFPEKKDKNTNAKRIRYLVRVRMGCFLAMLILLLLCVIF